MTRILVITMITIMGFITGYSYGKSHCEKQDNNPLPLMSTEARPPWR